jgi:Ca2+-binding RTX toxin-like protein
VTVSGLGAEVTIANFEATDRLVINGLNGNDIITASELTGMLFTADGGNGNDILIGTTSDDVLSGGAGNDLLVGNGGQDTLDGGTGHNTVFHSAVNANTIAAAAPSDTRSLALLNQFMASSFVAAGDDHGGTPIADPQAPQQPMLAQPHA